MESEIVEAELVSVGESEVIILKNRFERRKILKRKNLNLDCPVDRKVLEVLIELGKPSEISKEQLKRIRTNVLDRVYKQK